MTAVRPAAKIRWEDRDVPVSTRFDDPYYARHDGLGEARHVFLDGNRLAARFAGAARFSIAELGFGTGLNALAAAALWRQAALPDAQLIYTAFERFPMSRADIRRALAPWTELAGLADTLVAGWPATRIGLPGVAVQIVTGDARQTVPAWDGVADAWFLDGFAPARNPEMWEPGLMQAVHDRTARRGSFATYSAAGRVRRALTTSGFDVVRRPGFGHKREMLTGVRPAR